MIISICISLGSLLVAITALLRTFKKDRENVINNKKALIRAIVYKSEKSFKIKIWNDGNATARNIGMVPVNDCFYIRTLKEIFPYPILNKGDGFEMYVVQKDTKSIPVIKLTWDDDFKKENEREQALDF